MPFSEKQRAWTGVAEPGCGGNVCISWPDLTSKSLIEPSAAPVAKRWPSGWNDRVVSSVYMLEQFSRAHHAVELTRISIYLSEHFLRRDVVENIALVSSDRCDEIAARVDCNICSSSGVLMKLDLR